MLQLEDKNKLELELTRQQLKNTYFEAECNKQASTKRINWTIIISIMGILLPLSFAYFQFENSIKQYIDTAQYKESLQAAQITSEFVKNAQTDDGLVQSLSALMLIDHGDKSLRYLLIYLQYQQNNDSAEIVSSIIVNFLKSMENDTRFDENTAFLADEIHKFLRRYINVLLRSPQEVTAVRPVITHIELYREIRKLQEERARSISKPLDSLFVSELEDLSANCRAQECDVLTEVIMRDRKNIGEDR